MNRVFVIKELRKGKITETEAIIRYESFLDPWQNRWNESTKGRWTL